MGNLLTSRRALVACVVLAGLAGRAQADALDKPADPTTTVVTPQPYLATTAGTVHEDVHTNAALTPKAVAANQARKLEATNASPPWYSLSRIKGLLPSLNTIESWIPGLKRKPVTVRTVPRVIEPDAKTASSPIKPLAASQQARISGPSATSNVSIPQGERIAPVPAPEPSTWLVLALGGAGGCYWRARRARR